MNWVRANSVGTLIHNRGLPSGARAIEPSSESKTGDVVSNRSRREMIILRMLMEGGSNKPIALKLVITESKPWKVHMKAIKQKLRLQNRDPRRQSGRRDHVSKEVSESSEAQPRVPRT